MNKIFNKIILFIGCIGILCSIFSPIYLISTNKNKDNSFLDIAKELGTVGDFIGGSTVAFLTFASVMFIVLTYRMQTVEVRKAQEQNDTANATMRIQQFETSFYNLLNLFNEYKQQIKIYPAQLNEYDDSSIFEYELLKGEDAISYIFHMFHISDECIKKILWNFKDVYLNKDLLEDELERRTNDYTKFFKNLIFKEFTIEINDIKHIQRFFKNNTISYEIIYIYLNKHAHDIFAEELRKYIDDNRYKDNVSNPKQLFKNKITFVNQRSYYTFQRYIDTESLLRREIEHLRKDLKELGYQLNIDEKCKMYAKIIDINTHYKDYFILHTFETK